MTKLNNYCYKKNYKIILGKPFRKQTNLKALSEAFLTELSILSLKDELAVFFLHFNTYALNQDLSNRKTLIKRIYSASIRSRRGRVR